MIHAYATRRCAECALSGFLVTSWIALLALPQASLTNGPLLLGLTFAAGLAALLFNREVLLTGCFAATAVGALGLRGYDRASLDIDELTVVEVIAEDLDADSAGRLDAAGADLVRVVGSPSCSVETLSANFAYRHVYAEDNGRSVALFSCLPLDDVDTSFVDGATVLKATIGSERTGFTLDIVSVAGRGPAPVASALHDGRPAVIFAEGGGRNVRAPQEAQLGVAGGAASHAGISPAGGSIFFTRELACTQAGELHAGGSYLGRSATFRPGPAVAPVASL